MFNGRFSRTSLIPRLETPFVFMYIYLGIIKNQNKSFGTGSALQRVLDAALCRPAPGALRNPLRIPVPRFPSFVVSSLVPEQLLR